MEIFHLKTIYLEKGKLPVIKEYTSWTKISA